MTENMVKAWPAIEFECEKCGHVQYADYSLEDEWIDDHVVLADKIDCEKCGHENHVYIEK